MIGDWVYSKSVPSIPLQVSGVKDNVVYLKHSCIWDFDEKKYKREERPTCVDSSDIEFIHLAPEILEKNRFEKQFNYQWKYRDNGCKIVISIAPQIKIEGEILGEPPINIMLEGGLFDINITSDCYVHTLQHALRLCEIEKEIVL